MIFSGYRGCFPIVHAIGIGNTYGYPQEHLHSLRNFQPIMKQLLSGLMIIKKNLLSPNRTRNIKCIVNYLYEAD